MDQSTFSYVELIFMAVAVVISIPFFIFLKWILKELKNEHPGKE